MPRCEDWTPALVPPPAEGRSNPTNTSIFPPSPFILLSFAWFYIFFSAGQVLLSTLSWWSACTSVYEGVFLMYPWREMYSTSTYSSAILQSPQAFIFWSSKITADGDSSHEIKRQLLFLRKMMTNLDSILKSRDITLLTKVHIVKAMVFLVVMYGCESWTIKKAER